MILVKNVNFYACLFFKRKYLAILFNNGLEEKQALLNYKKIIFIKWKNLHFYKELTHDFGQKFELSCISVFVRQNTWLYFFYNVLE